MTITIAVPLPWTADAKCRGLSPALFFPEHNDTRGDIAAKAVCATCPVRRQCLDHALTHGESGVWGGTSLRQRRNMRIVRRRTAA